MILKKINNIFIVFLFFLAISLFGVWQLIQTEKFGELVSNKLSKELLAQFGVKLHFSKVEIGVFPPATILKNVELEKKDAQGKDLLLFSAKSLGFYFGYLDLFSNRLIAQTVKAESGQVKIDNKNLADLFADKKDDKKVDVKIEELIPKLFHLLSSGIRDNSPFEIESIEVLAIDFFYGKDSVSITKSQMDVSDKLIQLYVLLEKIILSYETQSLLNKKTKTKLDSNLDSLELLLKLSSQTAHFKTLQLKKETEILSYDGVINVGQRNLIVDGKIQCSGKIDSFLGNFISLKESSRFSGKIDATVIIKGPLDDFNADFDLSFKKLVTPWARLETLHLKGVKRKGAIKIVALSGQENDGSVLLKKPFVLFDFKTKIFPSNKILLDVKNLYTNSILHFLPELNVLKGRVTGKVDVVWDWDLKQLEIIPAKGTMVKDFYLVDVDMDVKNPILQNPQIIFNAGSFKITKIDQDTEVYIDLDVGFEKSRAISKAKITEDRIHFDIKAPKMDLEKFGPIVNTQLSGNGAVELVIDGPHDNVVFDFKLEINNFGVVGFNLGKIKGNCTLELNKLKLKLNDINGIFNQSTYKAQGLLDFDLAPFIDLSVNVTKGTYQDILKMYSPIIPKAIQLDRLDMIYSSKYRLWGLLDIDKLKVKGEFAGESVIFYGENVDKINFQFGLGNKILEFDGIRVSKGRGRLVGECLYDLNTEYLKYEARLVKLPLNELLLYRLLNSGLDGEITGKFLGGGTLSDFSSHSTVEVRRSYIGNQKVGDSLITFYNNRSDLFLNASLIGNIMKMDAFINLNKDEPQRSGHLNLNFNIDDLKLILGIISKHNLSDQNMDGRLRGSLSSSFSLYDWSMLNVLFQIDDFYFNKDKILIRNDKKRDKITVRDGNIEKWDVFVSGGGNYFKSVAEGSFLKKVKIQNSFQINSSILEILTPYIKKSLGELRGRLIVIGNRENYSSYFESTGKKLGMKIKNLPGTFEDIEYKIISEGNELLIQELSGKFGKGTVKAHGSINLKSPFPVLDIKIKVNNSYVPLYKKSNLVVSGLAELKGKRLPYLLSGKLSILHAEIFDKLQEFTKKDSGVFISNRFVPEKTKVSKIDFFKQDLSVDIAKTVHIKNQLMNLNLAGGCRVTGRPSAPTIDGNFYIVTNKNKIIIKGHEFKLDEGNVSFDRKKRHDNVPELSFSGTAQITDYKIRLNILGDTKNIGINFSSEPYLSQEDILSLLAMGITTDMSKNLQDSDRQALTSIGLGTMLVDQFRLQEGLDSSLGLKLRVLPEVSEDSSKIISRGSAGGETYTARLQSATKIELKKRISKKIDVAVSSTVGGASGQKQEMNLDYNINKNLSLRGVYEIKSTEDEEASDSLTSTGVDLKFQWTFK